MTTLRQSLILMMLDYGIRILKTQADSLTGEANEDINKSPTDVCEELVDKFFEEQSK